MKPFSSRSAALALSLPLLVVLLSCSSLTGRHDPAPIPDGPLPPLEAIVRVHDAAAARDVSIESFLDAAARADAVFLGETHLDDTTHRFEARVLEGLIERRGGKVVLSLEMFERDVQGVLDDYLAGRIDEKAFLAGSRPWNNYRTGYRALIETAKASGIPVVAANAPASVRNKVSQGGRAALDALPPEERRLLPETILPPSAAYEERVARAVRGHSAMMGGGAKTPPTEDERLFNGQNLWDNAMGDAVAAALAEHPGSVVLHVVGGFHVEYKDGTVRQFAARAPGARAIVASISPTSDLSGARPSLDAARADYLVYALARASGPDSGEYSIAVTASADFTLDVPANASASAPVPLVVWLPADGERPREARDWFRFALGDEAAVAVLRPLHAETSEDLVVAGMWTRPSSFRGDLGRAHLALDRLVEYVTRHFPVDRGRVLIGGFAEGALPVLATAQFTDSLDVRFLAVAPKGVAKLRQEALPDQPPAARHVTFASASEDDAKAILEDFASLKVECSRVPLEDPEAAIRAALGLAPRALPAEGPVTLLLLEDESNPRARDWADVAAKAVEKTERALAVTKETLADAVAKHAGEGRAVRVRPLRFGGEPAAVPGAESLPPFSPAEMTETGDGIPLAEGPFGGTTVIVVPAAASEAERAAWADLEKSNAIKKRGRFQSLAIAYEGVSPSLAETLSSLRAKGRRNLLIVPAVFCASAETMREIRRSAGAELEGFDVAFLPGLGGEVARLLSKRTP